MVVRVGTDAEPPATKPLAGPTPRQIAEDALIRRVQTGDTDSFDLLFNLIAEKSQRTSGG